MDGDEIRVAEKVLFRDVVRAGGLGLFFGQVLTPGDGLHAKSLPARRRALAELAETEDAEREALEVSPDRRLPGRAGFQPGVLEADVACELQHQDEREARRCTV